MEEFSLQNALPSVGLRTCATKDRRTGIGHRAQGPARKDPRDVAEPGRGLCLLAGLARQPETVESAEELTCYEADDDHCCEQRRVGERDGAVGDECD
jgi:hypothetical protein